MILGPRARRIQVAALAAMVGLTAPSGAWAQGVARGGRVAAVEMAHTGPAGAAAAPSSENAPVARTSPPRTTHDYLAEVRAGYTPENRAYWTTNVVLDLVGIAYGIAVSLIFLFGRISARIRDFAHGHARGRYRRLLIYFAIYSALSFLIAFPLSWYQGFALEHRYHLSTESFGRWLGDELKELGLAIAFLGVAPILVLAYFVMERVRRWWVVLAAAWIPLVVTFVLIEPVVIDPLFNKFTPLKDQALKQQILALAAKAGIPGRNVYQVDKSVQTKKYNAYVNGFGASQRIVLWDTTLKGMKPDEILFVMGHEMGHYRLGHIWKEIVFLSVLGFAVFYLSGALMTWSVRRFGPRWGFAELHDIASIPLFLLALNVVGLVTQPLVCAQSRGQEHQADTFGLEVTHLNDAAARAFVKLGSQNKSNPEPPRLLEWFEYTHPPLLERVRYALEYRPWEQGKPNQAFHPKP